ncbi:MAG: hypothetical protein ACJ8R9_31575 [Steroidobacteraceae bacterium]
MRYRAILFLTMSAASSPPGSAAASAPPAKHCASAEYRQFDFWVGSWDVYPTGGSQLVAHSLIEAVYNGCGVRENWMPLKTENSGGSLNIYLPGEKLWRQTWIDSSGARVDFKGGWNGKAMVLEGYWQDFVAPGKGSLVRMTYSKAPDGSVRQLGEASQNNGRSWQPSFDFTYRLAGATH